MNKQFALLYSYLHGMWRYRWSSLVITWIIALLGWLFMFSVPDQFKVKTVVYVDTTSALTPLLEGLAPETNTWDELQVMTRILLSRNNLMKVIRETDMDLGINTAKEKEELLESIKNKIKIIGGGSKRRQNNIYEIGYQSTSANGAYQMVSSLLNTMIEDTLKSTRTDGVSAQKFLDSQISAYEDKLSLAEKKQANFKKENVGYMPGEEGGYYMRLQSAKEDAEEISSALYLVNRRYNALQAQLKNESKILSNADFQSENAKQIKAYQTEIDLLLNRYTDRHPKVLALQMTIKNLKDSSKEDHSDHNVNKEFNPVYQEIKVALNETKVQMSMLQIKLKEKESYVNKLNTAIDIMPEVEAKLSNLNRSYEVMKNRYLSLVERRESAQLAQSVGQNASEINFRVIEPPIIPFEPSAPNRALISIGVLLASLAAGLAWGYLRYILQPTFTDFTQVRSITGFPVLGSIDLNLSFAHKKKRRWQLLYFVLAICCLLFIFGTVLYFLDLGVELAASIIKRI